MSRKKHRALKRDGERTAFAPAADAILTGALRFFRSELSPDVTAQRLLILLAVRREEGLSQKELGERLEATTPTALSRNLADLSSFTSRKQEGPGLVELRTDPMNLRVRRVYLTQRGKRLFAALDKKLDTATNGDAQSTKARSNT